MLVAFPRRRRVVIGATVGMVLLLSFVGGCSNNGNSTPIKLGNSVNVAIDVLNPAPGGGLEPNVPGNIEQQIVTVNPQ